MRKRLDELKLTGALPSPAGVGLAILALTRDQEFVLDDLARAIQCDPALTGRIIKLANSSLHAGLEPARNVSEAAVRLGMHSVRSLALSFTLVSGNRAGACGAFDYDGYWSRSLATAVAAQVVAQRARRPSGCDAFICGLLSGIGRLAFASVHPDRYEQVLLRAHNDGVELIELEREAFDLDHRELGAAMLDDWRLPASFGRAVATFESPASPEDGADLDARDLTLVLRAAARLARCELVAPDEGLLREVGELIRGLGLDPEALVELGPELRNKWREWGQMLQVPTVESAAPLGAAQNADPQSASGPIVDPMLQDVPRRRGLRILAIDDDAVSLRLLAHHLQRDGHTIALASNGREGLERALRSPPQMVLTDWTMPEMDGVELCKALRSTREGRTIYVLLLTGRGEYQRIVEAFDAGADDYVNKPFNAEVLLARVRAGQRMIELREQVEADRRDRARQLARMAVLNRKLKTAAMTDILTRLPNRRYAMGRLDQEVATALRAGQPLCAILIDIDHFKAVNDRYGHDVGDRVLQETAEVLKGSIRRGDIAARLGGEEFLVICPSSDMLGATQVAQRIRDKVRERQFGDLEGNLTVSLGVAQLEGASTTVDTLLKLADRRVYLAKARGRDQVCADAGDEHERSRAG